MKTNKKKHNLALLSFRLVLALNDVNRGLSIRKAASKWNVSKTTLTSFKANPQRSFRRPPKILSLVEESELARWVEECAKRGVPKTKQAMLERALSILKQRPRKKGDPEPEAPGYCWLKLFMQRNRLKNREEQFPVVSGRENLFVNEAKTSKVVNEPTGNLAKSVEAAMAQVILQAGIPFNFVDSQPWKQMIKLLNPSYAKKMPSGDTLESKYSKGNCAVCKSTLSNSRKYLRCNIGNKNIRIYEALGKFPH